MDKIKVIQVVMEDNNQILIYTGSDGLTKVEVRLEDDTLWLTQTQMCELYATSKSNVSEHIKHIFEDGELAAESVVRNFRTTAADGKSYSTSYYNLDMIIALGYRVRSIVATRFRQWAPAPSRTQKLWNTPPASTANTSSASSAMWNRTIWIP